MQPSLGPVSWERMIRSVEKVRERLLRVCALLDAAGIRYAVADGNAVAAWVSRVDEAAVRNTQDVDLLVSRESLPQIKSVLEAAGLVFRHSAGIDMFLDGPEARARNAVHLVYAGEKVRPEYALSAPSVEESEPGTQFRLLQLGALVRMKLISFRDKDRMHLRDLIDVGLVDVASLTSLPSDLASRLQQLLETPEG